jgi:molybdopterin converting factor small subunit
LLQRSIAQRNHHAMKVIFYGKLADAIAREVDVEVPTSCTVGDLRSRLDRAFPGNRLGDGRVRACIAGAIMTDDAIVPADQPVEFLAPVSGG